MRALAKMGLVMALAMLPGGTVLAQEAVETIVGPIILLRDRDVQEELAITIEQKLKLRSELTKVRDRHKDQIARVPQMKGQERESFRQAIRSELMKVTGTILNNRQMKRLEQIHLQTCGPEAFTETRVQQEVRLRPEQKSQIDEIVKEAQKCEKEVAEGNLDRPEKIKKKQLLRKEANARVHALLTDEQKQTWKSLTGDRFE